MRAVTQRAPVTSSSARRAPARPTTQEAFGGGARLVASSSWLWRSCLWPIRSPTQSWAFSVTAVARHLGALRAVQALARPPHATAAPGPSFRLGAAKVRHAADGDGSAWRSSSAPLVRKLPYPPKPRPWFVAPGFGLYCAAACGPGPTSARAVPRLSAAVRLVDTLEHGGRQPPLCAPWLKRKGELPLMRDRGAKAPATGAAVIAARDMRLALPRSRIIKGASPSRRTSSS
jgi:hypothetical protein